MSAKSLTPIPDSSGFYLDSLTPLEYADLDSALARNLSSEILMLRIATHRLFDLAGGIQDPALACRALATLGLSATRLSHLLKSEAELFGGRDSMAALITQAIREVLLELSPS